MSEEQETKTQEAPEKEKKNAQDSIKDTTEKLWDKTRKTFQSAGALAAQYKKMVQKKIDLAAVHKKISNLHADLGKIIDESRESGETDILGKPEVQELFDRLDKLKDSAAELLQEIEEIKREQREEHASN